MCLAGSALLQKMDHFLPSFEPFSQFIVPVKQQLNMTQATHEQLIIVPEIYRHPKTHHYTHTHITTQRWSILFSPTILTLSELQVPSSNAQHEIEGTNQQQCSRQ